MEHLKGVVDEWIVVDTGSSDNTKEIAKSFGAKIFDFTWDNDFAEARNFSLSHATAPWIFQMDPDERLSSESIEKLSLMVQSEPKCAYIFETRNYVSGFSNSSFLPCKGDFSEFENGSSGYFKSVKVRLFPNSTTVRYAGALHEQVQSGDFPEVDSGILVHHFNPGLKSSKAISKRDLYIACAQKKTIDEPNNWRAHYELGVELAHDGRWGRAADAFRKSLELNPTASVMVYIGLSCALTEAGKTGEAQDTLLVALQKFPVHPDVILNLGVSLYKDKNWADALESFRQVCKRYPDSSMGFYYAGLTLEKLKVFDGAKACFDQSLRIYPEFQKAKEALGRLETQKIQDLKTESMAAPKS